MARPSGPTPTGTTTAVSVGNALSIRLAALRYEVPCSGIDDKCLGGSSRGSGEAFARWIGVLGMCCAAGEASSRGMC